MSDEKKLKHADDSTFSTLVLEAKNASLVDFWAPWCGPCRAIGPVLDDLAAQYGGEINIVKVNVDESPATAAKFGVRSIPTLILVKDGKVIGTQVGLALKDTLIDFIRPGLN